MRVLAVLGVVMTTASAAVALENGATAAYPNGISGTELNRIVTQALEARGIAGKPHVTPARTFPPCNHVPEIAPFNGTWSMIRLSCSAPRSWARHLRSTANAASQVAGTPAKQRANGPMVVTLERSLKRGAVVTEADIRLTQASSSAALGAFSDPANVIGRKLTANVGEGRILLARQLEQDWMIDRNMPVEIGFENSAVSVSMPGIALENGQLGEMIEVKNSSSGRILQAIISGPQKVKINAKTH